MKKSESNFIVKSLTVFFYFVAVTVSAQSIAGDYDPAESKCKISLKINRKNEYTFWADRKLMLKGKVKISKEDQVTNLTFGRIGSMYHQDTISMQNYGNVMNDYTHLKNVMPNTSTLSERKNSNRQVIFNIIIL
ncbi:hypothetical protein [Chryseobacterium sp. Leaf201]|uniref:hypothetical protein n=1 Tax=Chryseobacterium sp. Leaf201 TaxID=1735672 RepID=UPI0006F5E248|nr:hypothetical protein [Chryseobacterium sp. Leaf201]KQM53671.1 hypothetical protein ASE55_07530 [Chryseobacterium sp. Leaf201]